MNQKTHIVNALFLLFIFLALACGIIFVYNVIYNGIVKLHLHNKYEKIFTHHFVLDISDESRSGFDYCLIIKNNKEEKEYHVKIKEGINLLEYNFNNQYQILISTDGLDAITREFYPSLLPHYANQLILRNRNQVKLNVVVVNDKELELYETLLPTPLED